MQEECATFCTHNNAHELWRLPRAELVLLILQYSPRVEVHRRVRESREVEVGILHRGAKQLVGRKRSSLSARPSCHRVEVVSTTYPGDRDWTSARLVACLPLRAHTTHTTSGSESPKRLLDWH